MKIFTGSVYGIGKRNFMPLLIWKVIYTHKYAHCIPCHTFHLYDHFLIVLYGGAVKKTCFEVIVFEVQLVTVHFLH